MSVRNHGLAELPPIVRRPSMEIAVSIRLDPVVVLLVLKIALIILL